MIPSLPAPFDDQLSAQIARDPAPAVVLPAGLITATPSCALKRKAASSASFPARTSSRNISMSISRRQASPVRKATALSEYASENEAAHAEPDLSLRRLRYDPETDVRRRHSRHLRLSQLTGNRYHDIPIERRDYRASAVHRRPRERRKDAALRQAEPARDAGGLGKSSILISGKPPLRFRKGACGIRRTDHG